MFQINCYNAYLREVILYLIALAKHVIWKCRCVKKFQRIFFSDSYIFVSFWTALKFRIRVDFFRFDRDKFKRYWRSHDNLCKIVNGKLVLSV